MTPLRQRMLYELQRRNYAPSTIRGYLGAVSRFAERFHRSPEDLGPDHLRHYQRYLLQEKKLAPSTVEMRISAGGGDEFHRRQIRTRSRAQALYRAVYQRT
jgi:integrase/recombinase XerD